MIELPAIRPSAPCRTPWRGEMQRLRRPSAACCASTSRCAASSMVGTCSVLMLRDAVELVDPSRHLLVDRRAPGARQKDAVQHAQARHLRRVGPGIRQRHHPAHRVTDKGCDPATPAQRISRREIVDMIGQTVAASPRPFGIAMPAQVRRDDMEMRLQFAARSHPSCGNGRARHGPGPAAARPRCPSRHSAAAAPATRKSGLPVRPSSRSSLAERRPISAQIRTPARSASHRPATPRD